MSPTTAPEKTDAPTVTIDREDDLQRMRYRCPNNHTRWTPTASHIYCHSCSRMADAGDGPEYHELLDAKTGETIPYDQVELV